MATNLAFWSRRAQIDSDHRAAPGVCNTSGGENPDHPPAVHALRSQLRLDIGIGRSSGDRPGHRCKPHRNHVDHEHATAGDDARRRTSDL